jgi:DNA polymerase III subunit delta
VGLALFLVHGNEEGLIHERARTLALGLGKTLGGGVLQMRGPDVVANPGLLLDEAYAIGLFGDKRALWIDADGRDLANALQPLLQEPPRDCAIVVEAGALKKGTALRDAFERSAAAASIECYPDDDRTLSALIDEEALAAGLKVSPEAKAALLANLGADRMSSRGELAKLTMYVRGAAAIEAEDVAAIVAGAAPSRLDAVIDSALGKELGRLESASARYFAEGGDGEELMRRLLQRVMLLVRLRGEMDQGKGFDAAAQALFVKLPFAARSALARQAQAWSSANLIRRLPALQAAAARIRRDPALADATAMRLLWSMGSGSAR